MILIADSGATKTDWRLIDEDSKSATAIFSEGLNPYFRTQEEIAAIISSHVLPQVSRVEHIYFYGAGCGLPQKADQVKSAIDKVIPTRNGAEVTGDTLAAARSILQDQPGICCILGTGSNACVYDGDTITGTAPSLGYMFSDWGSGTVLGKDFLALLLQEKLPAEVRDDFNLTFGYNRMQLLENIYNRPMANRFMASFTPFIFKHAEVPAVKKMIIDNFRSFFSYYVLPFEEFSTFHKVSMVGSIAYHFRTYVIEAASEMGIGVGKIVKNPMDGLAEFHLRKMSQARAALL